MNKWALTYSRSRSYISLLLIASLLWSAVLPLAVGPMRALASDAPAGSVSERSIIICTPYGLRRIIVDENGQAQPATQKTEQSSEQKPDQTSDQNPADHDFSKNQCSLCLQFSGLQLAPPLAYIELVHTTAKAVPITNIVQHAGENLHKPLPPCRAPPRMISPLSSL